MTKSVIGKRAKLLVVSSAINEKTMLGVLEGLAAQYGKVPIYKVPSHEDLAEYVGLTKQDENGKVTKRLKCAVASVEDFGQATAGQRLIFSKLGVERGK